MACIVNPDGTITCSDGDGAISSELGKVAAAAKNGTPKNVELTYPSGLGSLLKATAMMLRNEQVPMAVVLVNASIVDTA